MIPTVRENLPVAHSPTIELIDYQATEMPAVDHAVMGDLGYHVRTGKHDFTAFDWDRYLEFADKWFGAER